MKSLALFALIFSFFALLTSIASADHEGCGEIVESESGCAQYPTCVNPTYRQYYNHYHCGALGSGSCRESCNTNNALYYWLEERQYADAICTVQPPPSCTSDCGSQGNGYVCPYSQSLGFWSTCVDVGDLPDGDASYCLPSVHTPYPAHGGCVFLACNAPPPPGATPAPTPTPTAPPSGGGSSMCGQTCTVVNGGPTGGCASGQHLYVQTSGYPAGQCATTCIACQYPNYYSTPDGCGCQSTPPGGGGGGGGGGSCTNQQVTCCEWVVVYPGGYWQQQCPTTTHCCTAGVQCNPAGCSYPTPYSSPYAYTTPYPYPSPAWWQAKDSDLITSGSIRSQIPAAAYKFIEAGTGGYPGVPAYGGTLDIGSGTVSTTGWKANAGYSGRRYDYEYFRGLVPAEVFTDPASVITSGSINASELKNGYQKDGNIWRYRNGDLVTNGTTDLTDGKVILIVNGNLTIGNNITLTDGQGFFGTIVKGNITLASQVSHPNNVSLEGMFLSDGQFRTGTGARLYMRGSIVAWGGVSFLRDLGGSNSNTAAEFIEYAPDMILTFPRELLRTGIVWREIAP